MFLVPLTRRSTAFSHPLASWFDERSFDRFVSPISPISPVSRTARVQRSPALDVSDEDTSYTIQLDMPGVTKGDVKVAIDGRRVSVQATAQTPAQAEPDATPTEADRVVYSERTSASYARSFTLPTEVDQGSSSAKLENGVLTLTLVKKVAPQAAQLTVN